MATLDLQVLEAVERIVRGTRQVDDRVHVHRGDTIWQGELPAIDVSLALADPSELGADRTRQDLQLRVDVCVRERNEVDVAHVADPIADAVFRALMADRTLGGLVARLVAGQRRWAPGAADGTFLRLQLGFTAIYSTAAGDLSR